MADLNHLSKIIPVSLEDLIIKYEILTKLEIVEECKKLLPNKFKEWEINKFKRADLIEIIAKHFNINIGDYKFSESKMSYEKAAKYLFANLGKYVENRIPSKKRVKNDNPPCPYIGVDEFMKKIKSIYRKPRIFELSSLSFTEFHHEDPKYCFERSIKFLDGIHFVEKRDYDILTLTRSLLVDDITNTMSHLDLIDIKTKCIINSISLLFSEGDLYYLLTCKKMDTNPNSCPIKNLHTYSMNGNNIYKTTLIDNYFKMENTFSAYSFFNGTTFISTNPPEDIYKKIYVTICKKYVDDVLSFFFDKRDKLNNGKMYLEKHRRLQNDEIADKDIEGAYEEIVDLKRKMLFPEPPAQGELESSDFDRLIKHFDQKTNEHINDIIGRKLCEFSMTVNQISDKSIKINHSGKTATFERHDEKSFKSEVALRAALLKYSIEPNSKTLIVNDQCAESLDIKFLAILRLICRKVIICTNDKERRSLIEKKLKQIQG